jgi:hypothetical protein
VEVAAFHEPMAHKKARILWDQFKYREGFDAEVFKNEEERMRRAKPATPVIEPAKRWRIAVCFTLPHAPFFRS